MFHPSVITPTVLTLKTQIGGDISTCPNPYPVLVIANDGTGLGTANSKEEYCVLWNDYGANTSLGSIYPTSSGCEFNFYGNTAPDFLKIYVPLSIQSFTAGTSTINFTNNGGDDWTVGFKIAVNNMPSGWSVDDYDYNVTFFQSGAQTLIESGTKTADYDVTSNLNGNGAGVYDLSAQYNMSNGVDNLFMLIGYLIKVDGSGNIIGAIMNSGLIVNSVNGLDVNYTVDIEQVGVSEQLNVDAMDGVTFATTNLSHSENDTITLPLGTGAIAVYTDLDPTFWADLGSFISNPLAVGNCYFTIIS